MSAIEASILCGQRDGLLKTLRSALDLLASADLQLARAQAVDRVRWCGVMPSEWDAAGELRTVPEWARLLVDGMPRAQSASATASRDAMPEAIVLEGRLVPTGIGHDQSSLHGQAFLQGDSTLVCVESPALTERWRIERRSDASFVIPSGMGAIIVEQPERSICAVRRVDGSGREMWAIENLELFIAPNRAPTGAGVHPLLHGARDLIVARYDGCIGSVSLEDGKLTWSREVGLQEVLAIEASETRIVVSDIVNTLETTQTSLVAFDRKTGERLDEFKFEGEEIRWLRAAGPNSFLFGSIRGMSRLEAVGPFAGVVWQSTAARARAIMEGQVLGPVCVTTDIADRTALTDVSTGLLQTDRFTLPDGGRPRDKRQRWMRSGDLLLSWTTDGVALFGLDGSLRGRSALHGERTVDGVVPQSAALLAVEQLGRAAVARGMGAPSTTQVLLHRLGWSDGARLLGPAYEVDFVQAKLDRASAMDGWLLLGGPQSTVAVSLP